MTAIRPRLTRKLAASLAIEYCAFQEARRDDRANGVVVWGQMLLKTQAACGVGMVDVDTTEKLIAYARAKLAKEQAALKAAA